MNFLAHVLLTEPSREGILGAFMGDFVKGPLAGRFPHALEQAIVLHRAIDTYTDAHPVVHIALQRVSPLRRRFAGILLDVFFDHFLVRHWLTYAQVDLDELVSRTYAVLTAEQGRLPPRLRAIAPRIVEQDWLRSYGERDHIARTLSRMSTRLSRPTTLGSGIEELDRHGRAFEEDFHRFMPDLIAHSHRLRSEVERSRDFKSHARTVSI